MNFLTKIDCGSFAEYRIYETVSGVWYYGSLLEDYSKSHSVIILTPDALDKVKNKINENVTVIYIKVSNREIKRRMLNRDIDKTESKRRYRADKKTLDIYLRRLIILYITKIEQLLKQP